MLTIVAWRIDVQDGGGGRKEKMLLGTIQNEFAMRFSVNQGLHCGHPNVKSYTI